MIKKVAFLGVLLGICAFAGTAWGAALFPPTAGWGYDCTNWISTSTPITTNHLCFDPINNVFIDCGTMTEVVWPEFQFDLWIELEIRVHFDWTQAEIHRASYYEDIELIIPGWIEQNSGNYIVIRPLGSDANGKPYSLAQMNFIEDIFGRTDKGDDLPVTWYYSLDGVNYSPMTVDGEDRYFLIEEVCHHDFWYKVVIDIVEHEEDGFYKMHGDLCPLPIL